MTKLILALFVFTPIYVSAQSDSCMVLYSVDEKEMAYPRLSADNNRILYQSNETGKWQLMIMDMAANKHINISNDQFNNNFPDWSPDNAWVAFVSDRNGNEDIYLMRIDGSELKRVTDNAARDIHPYFSPDGKSILFNSTRGNGSFDIYKYIIASDSTVRVTSTREDETCARYSPGMDMIVYLKNGGNTDDVFIMDLDRSVSDNVTRTPYNLDGWPMFSSDGEWVYYSSFINGIYNIYKIRPDGKDRQQLTDAAEGEEDARVNISGDRKIMIYNKKIGKTISIMKCNLG